MSRKTRKPRRVRTFEHLEGRMMMDASPFSLLTPPDQPVSIPAATNHGYLYDTAADPAGAFFASGYQDGTVECRGPDGALRWTTNTGNGRAYYLEAALDTIYVSSGVGVTSRLIALSAENGSVRWSAATGTFDNLVTAKNGTVAVDVDSTGILLFSAATGARIGAVVGGTDAFWNAQIGDGRIVYRAGGSIFVEGISGSRQKIMDFPPMPGPPAVSPDGSLAAFGASTGEVRVLRTNDWSTLITFNAGGAVQALAISEDGKFLAVGTADGRIIEQRLADADLSGQVITITGSPIYNLAITGSAVLAQNGTMGASWTVVRSAAAVDAVMTQVEEQGTPALPEISVVPATPAIGPDLCRGGYPSPQGIARPFDTTGDLAYQGKASARPAVARDTIPGYAAIHQSTYLNDGMYGNGTSWIANSPGSWFKIDLGADFLIDRVMFGRDRVAGFDDRDPGQFTIQVAKSDDVYANGNESNDAAEYSTVFDSRNVGFSGIIQGNQTLEASFSPVNARYVKIVVANVGTAIDEVQIFAAAPSNQPPVPGNDSQTSLEDTPLTIAAGTLLSNDSPGPANESGQAVTFDSQNPIDAPSAANGTVAYDATTGTVTYTPAWNFNGFDTFTYRITDNGSPEQTATGAVTVTVASVNDAPQGSDANVSTREDTPYVFSAADFGFSDPNDHPADKLLAVKIATLPIVGSLKLNGVSVVAGQAVGVDDIDGGNLVFTPDPDASGTNYASFAFQVIDTGGTENGGLDRDLSPKIMTIDVIPVNDAPKISVPTEAINTQVEAPTLPPYGLSAVPATPAIGPALCRGGYVAPQCIALPFDTTGDLAYQGNGYAKPAVANGSLAGYPSIHQPQYANDGMYRNGTSWIGAGMGGTVKIDMGREVQIDRVMFGRDRAVGFDDRDPGQFTIQVAKSDDVYANGNESNDAAEYTTIFDSRSAGFDGSIWQNQTLEARFPSVQARYVKLTVTDLGAGVDEVQIFGPARGDDSDESPVQSLQARTQSTFEDQPLVFSTANGNPISITDVDALDQAEYLTLGVTHGTLALATANGLTFQSGANGTSSLSVTGTLAELNAALDGLTYTPTPNYNGLDALAIAVSDVGQAGPLATTTTVGLIIGPVNDPPTSA